MPILPMLIIKTLADTDTDTKISNHGYTRVDFHWGFLAEIKSRQYSLGKEKLPKLAKFSAKIKIGKVFHKN